MTVGGPPSNPGWSPPPVPPGAPGGQWGMPTWGAPLPRRTNPLAIVSLATGLGQFVVPVAAAIAAIITGHIARAQIRRTHEEGSGMALAGLILGYVGLALTGLAVAGIILFFVAFADDVAQYGLRDRGRDFAHAIEQRALDERVSPRDQRLLLDAAITSGVLQLSDTAVYLPDGTSLLTATDADLARNGWRIEMVEDSFRRVYVCLTVPPRAAMEVEVRDGRCTLSPSAGGATGGDLGTSAVAAREPRLLLITGRLHAPLPSGRCAVVSPDR